MAVAAAVAARNDGRPEKKRCAHKREGLRRRRGSPPPARPFPTSLKHATAIGGACGHGPGGGRHPPAPPPRQRPPFPPSAPSS